VVDKIQAAFNAANATLEKWHGWKH
jgi:hypothetical protein